MLSHKFNKYFFLLQLYMITGCLNSFSQEFSYTKYDSRDGLAGSIVYDALQDKEGFIWFATESGLSRFDGSTFKNFTTKDGLPDNEILKLFLDTKGRLWLLPFKPSLCYYYKGKIYNKTNDPLLANLTLSTHAFDMAEDKSGNLFIAEIRAWHTLLNNGTIKTVNKIKDPNISVRGLGTNTKGEVDLLVSELSPLTGQQHYLFNPISEKKKIIKRDPLYGAISALLINPEYVIIPDNHNSHLSFYKEGNEVFSVTIPKNTISISYIDQRRISVNTGAGIQIFDTETRTFSAILFKEFGITSAFQDKENSLWLTTMGSGIIMVPSFQFRNFSFSENKRFSEITALYKKENTVYAGGWESKIWKININDLSFSSFTPDPAPFEPGKFVSILSLNDKLILGDANYYQNPFAPEKKAAISLKSVSIGKSGIIFASHISSVLCKWSGEEETIWNERSTSAVEKDSGYYIGTLNGLYHKSYTNDTTYLGKEFPVFTSRIVNLAVSEKNVLWVITKGDGIAGYAGGKLVSHLTENDGLSSDNCTSLYLDKNIVWLGTDKGLNRIEVSDTITRITRFSMSDGLPSQMITAIVTEGSKVFVGTPRGLTYFDVDKISQTSACDLQFTGVYIAGKYRGYDLNDFSLSHKDNDIRFEYSGISFKSAGEMTYQYRLLGLQTDWRSTTQKELIFPALSSGKYLLQLKVTNKYGVKSNTREISFQIKKLLWEKTWFRLMTLVALAGAIWAFLRYRIRKVREKEKAKTKLNQRIAELEQKALRSQMNPHFIFNSLNSIQQYVAERDITGANNFITDFARLIRMTLDLSARTFICIADEITYIETYLRLEKTRLEDQFDYSIKTDETLDLQDIYLPPLLLQPYIENSIRHGINYTTGSKGLIQVIVQKNSTGVLVRIEDNGIGREAAKKYKSKYHIQYQSKGMNINKDRIDILNRYNDKKIEIRVIDLHTAGDQPAGTRVDIYLAQ